MVALGIKIGTGHFDNVDADLAIQLGCLLTSKIIGLTVLVHN
jgi:hypothetical protein